MTYLLDQMNSVVKKDDSPKVIQAKVAQLMTENSIKYQDELKIFYPFLLDCSAIQSSLIEPFWKSLPIDKRTQIRINGFKQMQIGVLQIYAAVLTSLGDSGIDASFKDSLLKSALDAAPTMTAILSLGKREKIQEIIRQLKKTAPKKYLSAFDNIYMEFSSKKCNEICRL